MPIKIQNDLPAKKVLTNENIFVMTQTRAMKQDIRPLKILILNLMPTKVVTETQLLRMLSNTPLQVEIDLIHTASHQSKNTSKEHLLSFYKTFDEVKENKYDGMIITGAPVENMEFEYVDYWPELTEIMDWTVKNVTSTLHICWAAQAAMYHHYGVPKYPLEKKMFGIFEHKVVRKNTKLLRGYDEKFLAPHSRHTEVRREDIEKVPELSIQAESDMAGVYIVTTKGGKQIFVTGHAEYDAETLHLEYMRDVDKGLDIDMPYNYYPNNKVSKNPPVTWRAHAHLLYTNWLNYFVYQETPYDINKIK
ncbi:MAG: homoserine O-succinyltransferase [Clostridia bacterium]|nr:homoserine O-succinyltransferase [Clostridia bacterium]